MDAILLFLKHPTPGRVKTRLAATAGLEAALSIYRTMVEHVCRCLPSEATPIVLFDPPESGQEMREWLQPLLESHARWIPQCSGDLGARLSMAFAGAFDAGFSRVAAIGCDCLDLTPTVFEEAFRAVSPRDGVPANYEAVIGPTRDGGYYLIALSTHRPGLFEQIAWSTEKTLADTLERAAEQHLRVFLLEKQNDIDTEEDWIREKSRFPALQSP